MNSQYKIQPVRDTLPKRNSHVLLRHPVVPRRKALSQMAIRFLKKWLRWSSFLPPAVAGERIALGMTWTFFMIGVVTVAIFAVLTHALYRDYQAARANHAGSCPERADLD